jgi:hypothetical protein
MSVCQFLLHPLFSPHPPTPTSTAALPPSLCLSQHTVQSVSQSGRPISNSRTSSFVLSLLLYHDCYVGATDHNMFCVSVYLMTVKNTNIKTRFN